uniref:Transmembrane protein n=1 Tax=Siphoviridae sp. ctwHj1 TaxID=2825727 RepID=A0A8S5U642_9CAUD|nr:MAG TPA: hypothetical protein [Siphoviridae sp. ctwHj1]
MRETAPSESRKAQTRLGQSPTRGVLRLSLNTHHPNQVKLNCLLSLVFCILALGICLPPLRYLELGSGREPPSCRMGSAGKMKKGERNLKSRFQFFLRFREV